MKLEIDLNKLTLAELELVVRLAKKSQIKEEDAEIHREAITRVDKVAPVEQQEEEIYTIGEPQARPISVIEEKPKE